MNEKDLAANQVRNPLPVSFACSLQLSIALLNTTENPGVPFCSDESPPLVDQGLLYGFRPPSAGAYDCRNEGYIHTIPELKLIREYGDQTLRAGITSCSIATPPTFWELYQRHGCQPDGHCLKHALQSRDTSFSLRKASMSNGHE